MNPAKTKQKAAGCSVVRFVDVNVTNKGGRCERSRRINKRVAVGLGFGPLGAPPEIRPGALK